MEKRRVSKRTEQKVQKETRRLDKELSVLLTRYVFVEDRASLMTALAAQVGKLVLLSMLEAHGRGTAPDDIMDIPAMTKKLSAQIIDRASQRYLENPNRWEESAAVVRQFLGDDA